MIRVETFLPDQSRVNRLATQPFNYKLYRISDYLLISEE
jgi:hypothetical protein